MAVKASEWIGYGLGAAVVLFFLAKCSQPFEPSADTKALLSEAEAVVAARRMVEVALRAPPSVAFSAESLSAKSTPGKRIVCGRVNVGRGPIGYIAILEERRVIASSIVNATDWKAATAAYC